jgi:hypothetical protein
MTGRLTAKVWKKEALSVIVKFSVNIQGITKLWLKLSLNWKIRGRIYQLYDRLKLIFNEIGKVFVNVETDQKRKKDFRQLPGNVYYVR